MWKVIVDYENYHRIDDEDGNTIAHIQPNYNAELELENEDSGDPNLEAIKTIAEKHNQRIAELDCLVRGHWHERRKAVIEKQPYMPEETLKRMMLLENRIAEQDLLLAQWESIDELNRERSQQRLQRIAQLEAESNKRLELLIEIYETDGVGLTSYILVKIEEELGDDYFNRHTT